MPEYSGPHRVPEGTDANNIPGDLVALAETIIPAMTTAQIDALDWSRKPAGRFIAYDTTKGRLVVSTGAAMVNVIDTRGGTVTGADGLTVGGMQFYTEGPTAFASATGYIVRITSGATRLQLNYGSGGTPAAIITNRSTASGDAAQTLVTKDYVDDVADDVAALGTWQPFTPTLTAATTNPTNWTQTGRYVQVGKLVHCRGTLTAGAGVTAGSGLYRIALPVAADTTIANAMCEGTLWLADSSTSNALSIGALYVAAAGYVQMGYATGGAPAFVGHATPWAWAAGDLIQFAFTYEAA